MTTAAICATREISWRPSFYRGEQFDPDLGLYYLRARYYNAGTGRFMSRDPYDGNNILPISLHKYLYAAGDAVNRIDPRGREAMFGYVIRSSAAIPEAKLISIYGCVAGAALTAVDLILDPEITASTGLGVGGAVVGCVVLMPGINDLAGSGVRIAKAAKGTLDFISNTAAFGSCALNAKHFVNGLNDLASGEPAGDEISQSIEALGGCVETALGYLLTHPGQSLQGLGLE